MQSRIHAIKRQFKPDMKHAVHEGYCSLPVGRSSTPTKSVAKMFEVLFCEDMRSCDTLVTTSADCCENAVPGSILGKTDNEPYFNEEYRMKNLPN